MNIFIYLVAAAAVFWTGMITFTFGGLIFVILAAVLGVLKLTDII